MGDRAFLRWIGFALLVIGGLGVLSALYSLGFWFVSLREGIWVSELHSYTFEWGYTDFFPDYLAMGFFCAVGARLGAKMVKDGTSIEMVLDLLGKWGVLVWGLLTAISIVLLVAGVVTEHYYFEDADALDILFADPLPTVLWPPEEGSSAYWSYRLQRMITDPSPNPAWLVLDLILSQTFWILGPLAISLWLWRGRTSKFANRAFAGLALLFAVLTIASTYLLIRNNWGMMTYAYSPDVIIHFADAPGFGAIPFYLTFVLMMLTIARLLIRRATTSELEQSEVAPTL